MRTMDGNQSIERAAAILRALASGSPKGSRLADVVAATRLSRSTAHRLLVAMAGAGLVEYDAAAAVFHLGWDLFAFGAKAASRRGLIDLAEGAMQRLADRTSDTVFLSVRSNVEAICIDRREGSFPIRTLTLSVGDHRPLGVGAGSLALLASLADGEIGRVLQANGDQIRAYPGFDAASLQMLVSRTRMQGYAFNDGRIVPGMSAVGVAIIGPGDEPVAALSVAAIDSRMQPDRRENIATILRAEATALSKELARLAEGLGRGSVRPLLAARRR